MQAGEGGISSRIGLKGDDSSGFEVAGLEAAGRFRRRLIGALLVVGRKGPSGVFGRMDGAGPSRTGQGMARATVRVGAWRLDTQG
jgi:hypothetical protein